MFAKAEHKNTATELRTAVTQCRQDRTVAVWTGAVTSSPQACGTPHNHGPATKTQKESLQHGNTATW